MKLKRWWFFFIVWAAASIFAIAYPLARGLTLFDVLIWALVACVPGQVLLIITVLNWRKLETFQKCLGLLPVVGVALPFAIFAA